MHRKPIVLVIAHQNYQSQEYNDTKRVLEEAGITVLTASDKVGTATATDNSTTAIDLSLEDIHMDEIRGIFLIGGKGALEHLDSLLMHTLLQKARAKQIPYGAICISPRILAHASVLQGINATGWDKDNQLTDIFQEYGVNYNHTDVVIDGLVVTATGPHAATEFGHAIVQVLTQIS